MARRPKQTPEEAALASKTRTLFSRDSPQVQTSFDSTGTSFAMRNPQRGATVTSAALRKLGDEDKAQKARRRVLGRIDRTWQAKAFDYADEVGELGAVLNLQANTVALCAFPVRKWSPEKAQWLANSPQTDDVSDTDDDYDDRPANVMRCFVGPQGGTEDLVRRAAYNLYCAGETHLLATTSEKQDLLWEFLSVEELYVNAEGGLARRRGGLASAVSDIPDESYTARLWRSSARYSDLADSEVRRVLPILQEVVTLTMVVDAISKSRIPANMMFIPEGMTVVAGAPGEELDPDMENEELDIVDEIFEHMTAPIEDPSSAARVVPLVVTGKPNESGRSGIEIIELSRNLDALSLQDLRQEALGRLAHGLDAPPEVMNGKATANHWTAANIDAEFIVKHIQPIGQLIAEFLTVAYLRPMLESFEDMSEEEAAQFKVEFDPSPVIARNEEAKSARELSEWLSDEAILAANGFTPADMASAETIRQRRLWELVRTQPAVFGKLIVMLDGLEDVKLEDVGQVGTPLDEKAPDDPNAAAGDLAPGEVNTAPEKDPVDAAGNETPKTTSKEDAELSLLIERVATAADAALGRAVERASSRVVSLASKNPDVRDRVKGRPGRAVSLVTDAELRSFSTTREKLLVKAWDDVGLAVNGWVSDFLEGRGMSRRAASERGSFAAFHLAEEMQTFAVDNLLSDFPKRRGLRVPMETISGIVMTAVAPVEV